MSRVRRATAKRPAPMTKDSYSPRTSPRSHGLINDTPIRVRGSVVYETRNNSDASQPSQKPFLPFTLEISSIETSGILLGFTATPLEPLELPRSWTALRTRSTCLYASTSRASLLQQLALFRSRQPTAAGTVLHGDARTWRRTGARLRKRAIRNAPRRMKPGNRNVL